MSKTYIAADIGGTHARIHLYRIDESGEETLIGEQVYSSQRFSTLAAAVNNFFEDEGIEETPDAACFSVAGPVSGGKVELTNLGWTVFEHELEAELCGKKVRLLNDFEACGYGISLLGPEELQQLSDNRQPVEGRPRIIIGAGTGLGEAFIFEKDGDFTVVPGEGGHSDFAPRNRTEFDMMQFIKRKLNLSRVAVERIVSGPGLENIYWFFASQEPKLENQELSSLIRADDNAGRIISSHAIAEKDVICEKALRLFVSCYGAETGNMALGVLPSGGVYVAGGIAPQLREYMKNAFLENFYDKGRMRSLLTKFPVYVVLNKSVGILGARYMAKKMLGDDARSIKRHLSLGDASREAMRAGSPVEEESPLDTTARYEISKSSGRGPRLQQAGRFSRPDKGVGKSSGGMANNLLMMGAGVLFSGIMVAAFLFGRNSNNAKE